MRHLSSTDMWAISSLALHTPLYRKRYIETLKTLLPPPFDTVSILDTACGIGFPSLDLYNEGFTNLYCSDASEDAIERAKKTLPSQIPVFQSRWEELSKKIPLQFDILLNVDNSLVYVDGWSETQLAISLDGIFKRISLVLKNFYQCLKPGGNLIVALTKKNHKSTTKEKIIFPDVIYKSQKVKVMWEVSFDWKSRIKTWVIHIQSDNEEHQLPIKSYIITAEELKYLLEKEGFLNIQMIDSSGIRDNLFISHKPSI